MNKIGCRTVVIVEDKNGSIVGAGVSLRDAALQALDIHDDDTSPDSELRRAMTAKGFRWTRVVLKRADQ